MRNNWISLKNLRTTFTILFLSGGEKIPFDKVFSIPDPDKLRLEEESEVIKTMCPD
jgi:hypothetical protein